MPGASDSYFLKLNSVIGSTHTVDLVPHATGPLSYGRGLDQFDSPDGCAQVRCSFVVVRGSNQVILPVGPRITRSSLVSFRGLLNLRSDMTLTVRVY